MTKKKKPNGLRLGACFSLVLLMLSGCVTTGGPVPTTGGDGNPDQQASAPSATEKVMTAKQKIEIVAKQIHDIPPPVFPTLPTSINRNTFGPMHKSFEFINYECHMALTPSGQRCSIGETLTYAYELDTLSSKIVQSILPQSMLVFDPELDRLGLRPYFKYPGAERKPHVSVIEATSGRIDFLVKMPKATVTEAYEAAKAYCTTQGKPARFAGVNVGCIRPDAALLAANQKAARMLGGKPEKPQNLWYSYGVMAFDCSAEQSSKAAAGEVNNGKAKTRAVDGKPANLNGTWVRDGSNFEYKIVQKDDQVTAYAQFNFPNLGEKKGFVHWTATLDGSNLNGDYLIRRLSGPPISQAKAICGEDHWREHVPIRLTVAANGDRLEGEWLNELFTKDCRASGRKTWDRLSFSRKGVNSNVSPMTAGASKRTSGSSEPTWRKESSTRQSEMGVLTKDQLERERRRGQNF